jgi:peptidoglycan lytic transglycosylase D
MSHKIKVTQKIVIRLVGCFMLLILSLGSSDHSVAAVNPRMLSHLHRYFRHQSNLWDALRANFQLPDYSSHPRVKRQIAWLLKSPGRFEQMLGQATPYLYHVHHEIKRRHLPSELALMPMIESAYDPFAYSSAGAAGLWQIMPGTGAGFGLKQNWWYDGRRDIYESTQAALDYLVYLHKFFDRQWSYAIAAYDSGEGTVNQAIIRNQRHRLDTDIWALKLPRETTDYVPRLFALVEIIKHPRKYGIHLPKLNNHPSFARIALQFQVKFKDVARVTKIKLMEIYRLNPGYNRWATDPDGPYHIVLPLDKIDLFRQHITDLSQQHYSSLKLYQVQAGDSLSTLAKRFNTTVALIQAVNKLPSTRIFKRQRLLLPEGTAASIEELSRNVITAKISRLGPKKVVYLVKARDSLTRIARLYHTTIASLQFWNQLNPHHRIKPGETLIIWQKQRRNTHRRSIHYRVRRGDALAKIARHYQVSITQLRRWNPKLKRKYIHPGQYIEIYKG